MSLFINSTSPRPGIGRVPTDPGQTSFEDNRQFKFLYPFNISQGDVAVIRFTLSVPINLFLRTLETRQGQASYELYQEGQGTFNGTEGAYQQISDWIDPVNQNLIRPGLSAHPSSGVVVEHQIGADLYVPGSPLTAANRPRAMAFSGGDGGQSGKDSSFSGDYSKIGYQASAGTKTLGVIFNRGTGAVIGDLLLVFETLHDPS